MSQFQFKRTGDADYPRYLKILLQGPPKSGKTTFIATAPNVVIAAVEAGLMSIAHLDVPFVEIDGTDKLQTLQTVLGDDTLRQKAATQLGLPKIETVAIDTLDAWQEMLKKEILKENRRSQMQQADWGTLKERMAAVLKAFVALPVNVIFTVHTTTTQDDESRLIYAPALQGSIKDDVAGFVDFSLLAFRDRQVDGNGNPKIAYYLKNEGDLKNPTLGNRAAGRVPEICVPDFKVLHDAVFNGIVRQAPSANPTEITVDAPTPVATPTATPGVMLAELPDQAPTQTAQPQSGAQNLSAAPSATQSDQALAPAAPAPAPAAPAAAPPHPTGTPQEDDQKPINAAGLGVLTKHYLAHSLALPEDVKSWNLGKARLIAKWFVAIKADALAGKPTQRSEVTDYLKAYEAYAGDLPGVQTGVENVPTPPKPAETVAEPVTPPAPAVDAAPTPSPEPAPAPEPQAAATPTTSSVAESPEEASAIALAKEQLGAVEIGSSITADSKCDVCGNTIDDVNVAILGQTRFKKVLCVNDYKTTSAAKASA